MMKGWHPGRALWHGWPYLVLWLATLPALWLVRTFPDDADPEAPRVVRPYFSAYPPAAYRWAEPGDSTDHAAVYTSGAALVLACWGLLRRPRQRLRCGALAMSSALFWHAATPGPLLDGWHGVGWRAALNPSAPLALRISLAAAVLVVAAIVVWSLKGSSPHILWRAGREHRTRGLIVVAAILIALSQIGWPDREPFSYWPRWLYVWGLLAWAFALLRLAPPAPPGWTRGLVIPVMLLGWFLLSYSGRGLFWYQRPLRRLREVVPGRVYISAMPSYWGLQLAQERHHFRTIINLFPEYVEVTSPHLNDELRFAREHHLRYVSNFQSEIDGTDYITQTLAVAQDPDAWPVLVHCHASMDRSPAWMGLYRFVVQGWPLAEALREVEHHRGDRPRASVFVMYNRVLPLLAPERYARDPSAPLFERCASEAGEEEVKMAATRDRTKG
jgi:Tyrosine phosphatase family